VAAGAEPPWAVAAVASSSVAQDERHGDRNQIIRQVVNVEVVISTVIQFSVDRGCCSGYFLTICLAC